MWVKTQSHDCDVIYFVIKMWNCWGFCCALKSSAFMARYLSVFCFGEMILDTHSTSKTCKIWNKNRNCLSVICLALNVSLLLTLLTSEDGILRWNSGEDPTVKNFASLLSDGANSYLLGRTHFGRAVFSRGANLSKKLFLFVKLADKHWSVPIHQNMFCKMQGLMWLAKGQFDHTLEPFCEKTGCLCRIQHTKGL